MVKLKVKFFFIIKLKKIFFRNSNNNNIKTIRIISIKQHQWAGKSCHWDIGRYARGIGKHASVKDM